MKKNPGTFIFTFLFWVAASTVGNKWQVRGGLPGAEVGNKGFAFRPTSQVPA